MLELTKADALNDVTFVLTKLQEMKEEIEATTNDERAVLLARDFFRTALLCALDTPVLNSTNFAQVRGMVRNGPKSLYVMTDGMRQEIVTFSVIPLDGDTVVKVRAVTPATVQLAKTLKKGDWVQVLGFIATLNRSTFLAAYGIRSLQNVSFIDKHKLN